MIRPPGLRRFLLLVRRSQLTDGELAKFLGVSDSFLWRLRNGKIQKMKAYIEPLEARFGSAADPLSDIISDLEDWSASSPPLQAMLKSLHQMAQESAEL